MKPVPIPFADIERSPDYQDLTQKQRLFVWTYIKGGVSTGKYDAVHATAIAYKCKNMESARTLSYTLLNNIRIISILDRHFGRKPIDAYVKLLDRALRNKKITTIQLELIRLKGYVQGFMKRAARLDQAVVSPEDTLIPVVVAPTKKRKGNKPGPKPHSQYADH